MENINDHLFKIACIIDNEYIGKREKFIAKRQLGYWHLSTSSCDMCSFIKVWADIDKNIFTKIEVLGDYTDGWQEIHANILKNVNEYVNK